jgi:hypothetical protein
MALHYIPPITSDTPDQRDKLPDILVARRTSPGNPEVGHHTNSWRLPADDSPGVHVDLEIYIDPLEKCTHIRKGISRSRENVDTSQFV